MSIDKKKLAIKEKTILPFSFMDNFPGLCVGLFLSHTEKRKRVSYKQAFTLITLGLNCVFLRAVSRKHGACSFGSCVKRAKTAATTTMTNGRKSPSTHTCTMPFYILAYRSKDREKLLEILVYFLFSR